jgi:hypothetical protein
MDRRSLAATTGATLIAFGCLLAPPALFSQQCGAGTSTFEWHTIHVAVAATDSYGVALQAFTSAALYQGTPHHFSGYFDPDSAANWVAAAARVAEASGRADPGVGLLQTPALFSTDGSHLVARRTAKHGKWTGDVAIVMISRHDSAGFQLITPGKEADTLFRALFGRALQSHLVAGGAGSKINLDGLLDSPPAVIHAGTVAFPEAPDGMVRDGEVVTQFVVGVDGRPDMSTFCAIATDGPEFTAAAHEAVLHTQFTPGMLHGAPVRTRVMQNVEFRWHRP